MATACVCNAFSIQMLENDNDHMVSFRPITANAVCRKLKTYDKVVSAIGHADTAAVISDQLNMVLPMNRCNVRLADYDKLYVAQLTGGRLPEGSTTLPEGFEIKWWVVSIVPWYMISND